MKNKLDNDYLKLISKILNDGIEKKDRTGTGTKSIFGERIIHKMSDGFPLLTSKKMAFRGIVGELLWFLKGDTNISWLLNNNINIWNGDVWKNYKSLTEKSDNAYKTKEEFFEAMKRDKTFAHIWGDLGPIYGHQWRKWGKNYLPHGEIDQISNLINDLKNNPDSRRLMVNAWDVSEIENMVLPPCHYSFQCYTRELTLEEREIIFRKQIEGIKHFMLHSYNDEGLHIEYDKQGIPRRELSLMWNQRSVDTCLGLPFNIASYGLLLILLSKEVNMIPGNLIGSLGDTHIYLNQIPFIQKQLNNQTFNLPKLKIENRDSIFDYEISDFELVNYEHGGIINYPLSN